MILGLKKSELFYLKNNNIHQMKDEFLKNYKGATLKYYKQVLDKYIIENELVLKQDNAFSTFAKDLGVLEQYYKFLKNDSMVQDLKFRKEILQYECVQSKQLVLPKKSFQELLEAFEQHQFDNISHKLLLASYLYKLGARSDIQNVVCNDTENESGYVDYDTKQIVYKSMKKNGYACSYDIPAILWDDVLKLKGSEKLVVGVTNLYQSMEKITENVFGESILSGTLRKIYESHYYDKCQTIEEKIDLIKRCGHTPSTFYQWYNIIKKDSQKDSKKEIVVEKERYVASSKKNCDNCGLSVRKDGFARHIKSKYCMNSKKSEL